MAISKAQQKAVAKYEAKAYDKTLIRLPKGRLDEIRTHIEPTGESLNGFIGRAIDETMERDGSGAADTTGNLLKTAETPTGAGVVSLPPDTLETAQRAAEATGETMEQFVERAVVTQTQRDKGILAAGYQSGSWGQTGKGGVILWHYQRRT